MIFHFRVLTKINYACKLVKEKINPEFFMDIKIRKFEDRDAALVAVIMFGSFRAVFGDLLGTEAKPESYWKEISHSERGGIIVTSFVAETDNNVIGYLRVSINPGNGLGVLEVIGVDPEFGANFLIEFQDRLYFGTDYCCLGMEFSAMNLLLRWREEKRIFETVFQKIARENAIKFFDLPLKRTIG